jgi:hypothetical protein
MKTLFTLITAAVISASTLANPISQDIDRTVRCFRTPELMALVTKELGEVPIWLGTDSSERADVRTVVVVNPSTSAWSIIEYNDRVACVLAVGEGFSIAAPKRKNSV